MDPALRIADAEAYDFPDGFKATLRFSADLSKVNPKSRFANLFTKGRDFNDGYSVMIREDGHLLFYFLGVTPQYYVHSAALESNREYLLEVYRTPQALRVFIDGEERGSLAVEGGMKHAGRGAPLRIGSMGGYWFAGTIASLTLEDLSLVALPPGGPKPCPKAPPKVQARAEILWAKPICVEKDRYVGWPSVARLRNGELMAAFLRRDNPVTEVTLPVEGEYVFRLATTGFLGASSQGDAVKVTRDDAAGEASVAPAADVAAAKKSAETRASLSDGLVRHWKANGIARREEVSKTIGMTTTDWSLVGLTNGVTGFAFMSRPGVAPGGAVRAELTAGETAGTYGAGYEPANEWLSVSAWIRPEAYFPSDWYSAIVACQPFSFNVCFGQWWKPETADGPLPGFSIQQVGIQGFQGIRNYELPEGTTMEGLNGKWSHVVALVNRHETSQSSFYLDGVKLAENESRRNGVTYGTYSSAPASNFSGQPAGGRFSTENVTLLNAKGELDGANNVNFCASNKTTNVRYSRRFPGAVDEIRFYNRKLTDGEIAYLFAHPDLSANAAPVVAKATSVSPVVKKRSASVAAEAADDGNGTAAALEYEWRVVKGDATKVVFADPNAAETTVTVNAKGSYAFLLRVSDGERATSGEPVEVEVVNPGITLIVR